jgi:hypothetical protein
MMIDGQVSLEKVRYDRLNAEETLALGMATLKAAFLSPTVPWLEGVDMMAEAFELRLEQLSWIVKKNN